MYTITQKLSRPCQIDMEITSACNHSCRYCYNFWRHDKNNPVNTVMSMDTIDRLIDEFIANKVFNVVLTGGEPFTNYKVLLHGVRRLAESGILVSCNSNLTMSSKEQLRELYEAGLPHILTSLASFDPEQNDRIFNRKGAFVKVVRAIRQAVDLGIKISVNTVISRQSADQPGSIYKTGLLAHALGATNLFLTRVVPNTSCPQEAMEEFILPLEHYVPILEESLRVKEETHMNIGSLIQYPVCFLRDIKRYKDFLGRGCPAGRKMVCINADGQSHACFHESESYGNVLEIGLKGVWENMKAWRDDSLIPEDCQKCKWFRWCEGGCRVYAERLNAPDFMCKGSDDLPDPMEEYKKYMHLVHAAGFYRVRQGLRYREEDGFWLAHIVGAWITPINETIARFLVDYEASQKTFGLAEFPEDEMSLAYLLSKKLVETIG